MVLRHQLAILRRTTRRPAITAVDRLLLAVASRLLPCAGSLILNSSTLSGGLIHEYALRREVVSEP